MGRPIRPRSSSALVAALLLGAPEAAAAQAYQCRVPATIPTARAEAGQPRRMPIAGYTLAQIGRAHV